MTLLSDTKHKKLCILSEFYVHLKHIALLRLHKFILLNLTIYIYIYIQPQGFQRFLSFEFAPLIFLYYIFFTFYLQLFLKNHIYKNKPLAEACQRRGKRAIGNYAISLKKSHFSPSFGSKLIFFILHSIVKVNYLLFDILTYLSYSAALKFWLYPNHTANFAVFQSRVFWNPSNRASFVNSRSQIRTCF